MRGYKLRNTGLVLRAYGGSSGRLCGRLRSETVSLPGVIFCNSRSGCYRCTYQHDRHRDFSMAMNQLPLPPRPHVDGARAGLAVAGAVGYSGSTATFYAVAVLAYATTYTATITLRPRVQAALS